MHNICELESIYAGSMTFRAESLGLHSARRQVSRIVERLNLCDDDATDLMIAVGEAISNAYSHGTPDPDNSFIYLTWQLHDDVLTITVRDEGPGFIPIRLCTAPTSRPSCHGHGINLMKESMDEIAFDFNGGSSVIMKKRISPEFDYETDEMMSYCQSGALMGSP